jgi:pimeloyl-ACP methyl ester carboxylesterase
MPTIDVDGLAWHFHESGNGIPLVLVHGFPLDARIFDAQLTALATAARVITPDLPGFGKSSGNVCESMDTFVDALRAFLSRINALPCVLGGLSMGGYVLQAYARRFASDLLGLALMDTRAEPDTPEGRAARDSSIRSVSESGTASLVEQMLSRLLSEHSREHNPALVQRVRDIMLAQPAATVVCALKAIRDRDNGFAVLRQMLVPALVIVGEQDVITPVAAAEQMHACMRDSRLVRVESAGHLPTMERAHEVNRALLDLIRRCETGS